MEITCAEKMCIIFPHKQLKFTCANYFTNNFLLHLTKQSLKFSFSLLDLINNDYQPDPPTPRNTYLLVWGCITVQSTFNKTSFFHVNKFIWLRYPFKWLTVCDTSLYEKTCIPCLPLTPCLPPPPSLLTVFESRAHS